MKKTLVALAALVATTAFAQSSVSLYGSLDMGYSQSKSTTTNATATNTTKTTSWFGGNGQNSDDRLGIQGSEDLGGGLTAGFQYEMGLAPDAITGNAIGAVREATLSLAGGFGSVKIGTFTNVFDNMVSNSLHNATGLATGFFPSRTANSLQYTSPNFGGFSGGLMLVNEKKTTATATSTTLDNKDSGFALNLNYAAGSLAVDFGYGNLSGLSTSGTAITTWNSQSITPTAAGTTKTKETAIKVGYDLGVAVPFLLHRTGSLTATTASTGRQNVKVSGKFTEIGASFPMGDFTPYISYGAGSAKDYSGTTLSNRYSLKGYELGVDYALSKRTTVYGTMGQKSTKTTTVPAGTVSKSKTNALAIGVAHTF